MSRTSSSRHSLDTLVPSAARTASGNSGTIDVSGVDQLRVQLNVTAASGTTPNLTVFVQDSLDGTNWNDLTPAFAAKTAAGLEVINITTPFSNLVRVRWAITGTTPSFTFSVVASSKAAV